MAAESGEAAGRAFEKLDVALKNQPREIDLAYNAASAYALASQALAGKDAATSRALADRAINSLKTAIENGYSKFSEMQVAVDLDPIGADRVWGDHAGRTPGPRLRDRLEWRPPFRGHCGLRSRSGRTLKEALATAWPRSYRMVSRAVAERAGRRARDRCGVAPARGDGQTRAPNWPSAEPGRRLRSSGWARPRRSGRCFNTAQTPGCGASSISRLRPLGADPHAVAAVLDQLESASARQPRALGAGLQTLGGESGHGSPPSGPAADSGALRSQGGRGRGHAAAWPTRWTPSSSNPRPQLAAL